ncbi:uncharacterized protein ISCGN_018950 [Ixodes scapularis]
MLEKQAELMLEVRALKRLVMPGLAQSACVQLPEGCPQLPVSSVANVEELDNFLSGKESLESMIGYCSKFGGTDEKDATRRVLRSLIDNETAKKISWRGSRGEKAAFCEYKWLQKLLFAAVHSHFSGATTTSVKVTTKAWFQFAADRNGGRNARRKPTSVSNQPVEP